MAKKPQKTEPDVIELPIEWRDEMAQAFFANHMIVQLDEHECYLSFYEIRPPLVHGDEAQRKQIIEELKSVQAIGKARIIISRERLPKFVEVLQRLVSKSEDAKQASKTINGHRKA